ncbi:MAG TPA: acetoacetate--CoA ligase [Acidimicrobiales bacterium]|nr:acetoacetate--CoA ligase [Acidimicrobiales bacterium]
MTRSPLWRPDRARAEATHLARFLHHVGQPGYAELHQWSLAQPEAFWTAVWDQCGVIGDQGDRALLPGVDMPTTRFFPEARLNVAENLLHRWDGEEPAIIAHDEAGHRRELSGRRLREEVAALAAALQASGVTVGDRVAAWLPNGPEAVVAMLAATSLGALFSSCSPDFGTRGVLDRFGQIEPVVLLAADGYCYNAAAIDCLERLGAITAGLPTLRTTVVVPTLSEDPDLSGISAAVRWDQYVAGGPEEPTFVPLPFDHPWYVLYSSGTTGPPKCIVHRAGGALLMHLKEHQLLSDIHRGDRVLYYTTTGWMMWNWLVSALASGATIVLYDGSPFVPGPDHLFDIVDEEGISLLGVSAKLIDALAQAGLQPSRTHGLGSLRTICSTGSPLSPEGFRYVYEQVKDDVHLASISGGTDLCGCLVAGDPTGPVYAGEIQQPALGMAIGVWSDEGHPLAAGDGPGELVCTAPFPSMPLGFWDDGPLGAVGPKYRAAYFERFPGVWCQGDFASWTEHGGIVIHGRSDATLNPGGVRIGTADIYRVVEQQPGVVEALVFGQQWEGDVRIVLVVRLQPGISLDESLRADLRTVIRRELSPRHVPAVIVAVDDLPRTRSGKLVELAVADAVNGRPVRNREAIANPEAIDAIAAVEALQS